MRPTPDNDWTRTATIIIVLIATVLAVAPNPVAAASVDRFFCNNIVKVWTDAGESTYVRNVILENDYLRVLVQQMVAHDVLKRNPLATLDKNWGVGYQIDDSVIAGVRPLAQSASVMLTLSFSHLKSRRHHLRIGIISPDGQLEQDNAYCFSSPGQFTLTSP